MSSPASKTAPPAPADLAPSLPIQPGDPRNRIVQSQVRQIEETTRQLLTARNDLRAGKIGVERLLSAIMLGVAVAEIALSMGQEQLRQQNQWNGGRP